MAKTLLYIGGFELPDKNAAAHRVLAISKALRDIGFNVILVGVTKSSKYKSILDSKKNVQGFVSYEILYPKGKKEWIKYLTSTNEIKQIISSFPKIDGIICYNYQAVAFEKLRLLCKRKGIKIYADCTEWYNTEGASPLFKLLKGFDTWFRMRVIQKKLDGLILISEYLKNYYKNCKNVIIIPPLVDITEEKWYLKPERLADGINFVYTGKPGNKDKIAYIIEETREAMKRHLCNIWIIGITEKEFLEMNPNFKKNEIAEDVHFLGRVSHQKSLSYVKGADCSLIIRDSNRTNNAGFPTKFVESVTLGTDVIATDISDLKNYSNKIKSMYIADEDLKEAIMQYINRYGKKDKKEKRICELFDFRKWENDIRRLDI